MKMLGKASFSAIAAMAAFSMASFTACSDDAGSNPSPSAALFAGEPSMNSASAGLSKPRNCDDEGVTVGSICVKEISNPTCSVRISCGAGTILKEFVYMGDGILEDFESIANKSACTAENEGAKQKLTYGDESYKKTQYYMCESYWPTHDVPSYRWFEIDEVAYNCAAKPSIYTSFVLSLSPAGDICSFESSEGKQNYLSVYFPGEKENIWYKFEPNSELGPCPTEYAFDGLFSKRGENIYKCFLGEWSLAEGLVPQQYLDPRKDGLTDEEYDLLDLPQNATVGDRAAGLLEDCSYKKEFSRFGCNSEVSDKPLAYTQTCWEREHYDVCEPRNYYRYRENGSWTLETDEDRLNDSRFQQPECTEENKDSVFEMPPQPGEPGKVYKCILNSASVFGGFGMNLVADYIFHRSEKLDISF